MKRLSTIVSNACVVPIQLVSILVNRVVLAVAGTESAEVLRSRWPKLARSFNVDETRLGDRGASQGS